MKVTARPGQRMRIEIGVLFEVIDYSDRENCSNDFIKFSSPSNGDSREGRRCGQIPPGTTIYTSQSDTVEMSYRSTRANNSLGINIGGRKKAQQVAMEMLSIAINHLTVYIQLTLSIAAFRCERDGNMFPDATVNLVDSVTYGESYSVMVNCSDGFLMEGNLAFRSVECEATSGGGSSIISYNWQTGSSNYTCISEHHHEFHQSIEHFLDRLLAVVLLPLHLRSCVPHVTRIIQWKDNSKW